MSDDLVKRLRNSKGWPTLGNAAADRIEELETELAKAVEALKDLADCVDDGCFCSEMHMAAVMDTAHTTLAKLKGETNDQR